MRFAYIDSQGNEVSIPSVDALALRIELGAIGPDTQLYDAQADHWGPAHTHEIFHTLSRSAEEGGFVAPPPPVARPEAPAAPAARGGAVFDVSEDLGLPPRTPEPAPKGPAASDDLGFDFTLTEPVSAQPEEPPAPAEPPGGEEEDAGAFDFGVGALELESAFEEPVAPGPAEPEAPAMDFSQGGEFGGGLTLEQPLSEFTPESPPAWMEQSGPEPVEDGAMSFDRTGGVEEEEERPVRREPAEREQRPARERPEPRSRPSPPRRRRGKPIAGMLGGVVVLAVVGGGGWFGWQFLQGRERAPAEPVAPGLPEVTIPDIPAELLPTMRELGDAALSATIAELGALPAELGLPAEPNGDWLAGVYLANASQFRDVQEYWEGIEALVERVRESDTQVFHDRYVAQLESAGITGDDASMLLARADSGFLATRADRFEVYALMDDLVNASLDLHGFLLQNEARIEYAPAAGGVSRDPVLEAVPASKELGDAMWGMVDGITAALDALGTLDRVTTERLSAVLFDRVRRAGFR